MDRICLDCGQILNSNELICRYCGSDNTTDEISKYHITFGDLVKIEKISKNGNFVLEMVKLKNEDPIEYELKMQQFKQVKNQPHCPTCNSTNIEKIPLAKKAVGAFGFGLFSKTARSQFYCKDCGYKW